MGDTVSVIGDLFMNGGDVSRYSHSRPLIRPTRKRVSTLSEFIWIGQMLRKEKSLVTRGLDRDRGIDLCQR